MFFFLVREQLIKLSKYNRFRYKTSEPTSGVIRTSGYLFLKSFKNFDFWIVRHIIKIRPQLYHIMLTYNVLGK